MLVLKGLNAFWRECNPRTACLSRVLFIFACEAAGASSARHSLRPLNFRCASYDPQLARMPRRDRGGAGVRRGEKWDVRINLCVPSLPRVRSASVVFVPPTCGEGGAKRRVGVARDP